MAEEMQGNQNIQAENNSIAFGELNVGGSAGDIHIGHTIGYTSDQVSALITQISSTFQPKPFNGRSPYKGLDYFEENDAELFFGREKLVDDLVIRVKESRTLFVTGPSGSGKSSLVRAGLIHALKQGKVKNSERWLYGIMKPGREPIAELARVTARLAKSTNAEDEICSKAAADPTIFRRWCDIAIGDGREERVVLFIDQFEEVFTQINRETANNFVELLDNAVGSENGRVILLFAMRSDFVPNCAAFPKLNALLNRQFVQIGAMGADELVSAIAQPALRVGLRIEPDLIAQIINDMKGEPGALPLMQFALKDLFDSQQAQGGIIALTLHDYLQRGGIRKALERHADDSFKKLDSHEQELARSIFTGLIEIGRGTQDTRRIAMFDELVPAGTQSEEVEIIVRKLADARLITTDQIAGKDTVTISHEKLIDAWPWLKKLVNENRDVIALQNEIISDAKEWEEHGRDTSYLYSGARLGLAQERLTSRKIVLSGLAREFIEEGARVQDAEIRKKEILRKRIIAGLTAGIAIALVLAGIAMYQTFLARKQARITHAGQLSAQSVALRDKNFSLSLLLGIEAYREDSSIQTMGTLLDNAQANPYVHQFLARHRDQVFSVAFSPDGKMLASGSRDKSIILWNVEQRQPIGQPLSAHNAIITSVAFSPDGSILASGGDDKVIVLWDVQNRQAIASLTGHEGTIYSVAFSPDGRLLASGSKDGTIRLWDVASRQPIDPPLKRHTEAVVTTVAFSPDGRLVASGSEDKTITLWNLENHQPIEPLLTGHAEAVGTLAFSPDGKFLASGAAENNILLWDVERRQRAGQLSGHEDFITSLAFSPDGTKLVSGSLDRTVILWDFESRLPIGRPRTGHASWVRSVAFGPDGQTMASGGTDNIVILWDVEERPLISQNITRHDKNVNINSVAVSPDGRIVASGDGSGRIVLWDRKTGQSIDVPGSEDRGKVFSLSFSPDGWVLASGNEDGSILLWDIRNHRPLDPPLAGHADPVFSVAFSPDGKTLASGSADQSVLLWNVENHQRIGQLIGHKKPVTSVAFSPDGRLLASGSEDTTILIWDVVNQQLLEPALTAHRGIVYDIDFSPDGRVLASGSADQTVILWDVEDHQPIQSPFASQRAAIYGVAFSPDGNTLASGGYRSSIQLWNVENRKNPVPLGEPLTDRMQTISNLAFSLTDPSLISAGTGGSLVLWDLELQHWINGICARAGRNLSGEEWNQYQPGKDYRVTCPGWLPAEKATTTP